MVKALSHVLDSHGSEVRGENKEATKLGKALSKPIW